MVCSLLALLRRRAGLAAGPDRSEDGMMMETGWTIEEAAVWIDGEGGTYGWAVIDEDGAEIEFFRNREDAEEYLTGRQEAWAEQAAEAAAERRWERG